MFEWLQFCESAMCAYDNENIFLILIHRLGKITIYFNAFGITERHLLRTLRSKLLALANWLCFMLSFQCVEAMHYILEEENEV